MLTYLLKSALLLALLWLPYGLLLRRESFHRFNRWMLVSMVLLALLLPLLEMPQNRLSQLAAQEGYFDYYVRLQTLVVTPAPAALAQPQLHALQLGTLLLTVYIVGAAVRLLLYLHDLWRMLRRMHSGVLWQQREADGVTILCHASPQIGPFSFLRTIVISEQDYVEHRREILAHERAHIRLHHSYDVLLVRLAAVVQWFNPCIYLLARDLADVHEYEADSAVLSSGISARNYQFLLVKKAVGSSSYTFANSFNHSLLKKRIAMMLRKKSSPWRMAKSLYMAPVALAALLAFATPELSSCQSGDGKVSEKSADDHAAAQENAAAQEKVAESTPQDESQPIAVAVQAGGESDKAATAGEAHPAPVVDDDVVFDICEELPSFEGGMTKLMTYLQKNIRYPKEAMEKGVEGHVTVGFVVEKDGSISNPSILKSASPLLDAEALRVVRQMPKWQPGKQRGKTVRTKFALPVTFRLQ